jgi:PAS domain S-box-containing protein
VRGPWWKPLLIVAGLLLLLTYLLIRSRSPELAERSHLYEALYATELHDAELTRDVLLARAGLLPHYDALMQAHNSLLQVLDTLRHASQRTSGEAASILSPHVEALDAAVRKKLTLVEHFKADNALLRNSFMYVLRAGQALRNQAAAAGEEQVVAEIGALSHALLRFSRMPQPAERQAFEVVLDRLLPALLFPQELTLLVAHGRLIVEVLPQVDALLHQLVAASTTTHTRALREAALQYYGRVEASAQLFRWLLYLVAVTLLGYLLALFVRLRRHARDLSRANAALEREMAERQQAEVALRAGEERFRAITETANEAIVSADQSGTVVSWNAAATAIFGYEAAQALGTPLIGLIPERHRDVPTHAFVQWTATGCLRVSGTPLEGVGLRQEGREFPLELSLSTWTTAQGTFLTSIIRDLTERKQLEEQTRQQELQLIQANKMTALGTLVSSVAHEINNPNQLVRLNAQVLADTWHDALGILDAYDQAHGDLRLGGLPYAEMRETIPALVRDVHDGALRIERIVNDLRDFARPRALESQATFDLNEAVQRALRLLTPMIRRKTAHFCVELAEGLPPVRGERQQVEQIVVNLVVNALEALPDTGAGVSVATGVESADSSVILLVQDEGIGIPSEHLERLCDPFFTTKHESGGTGLGLAITATLVQAHGGRLTFASQPGQGTRAVVTLPYAKEPTLAY